MNTIEVTITRRNWLRGATTGKHFRDQSGCMCAMGFIALAAGYQPAQIEKRTVLPVPTKTSPLRLAWEADIENQVVNINDAMWLDDTQREAKLIEECEWRGINLRFEN